VPDAKVVEKSVRATSWEKQVLNAVEEFAFNLVAVPLGRTMLAGSSGEAVVQGFGPVQAHLAACASLRRDLGLAEAVTAPDIFFALSM